MDKGPTLICIPDISGFTKFMSETEADFNSRIIPSLLNKIIYSNEIGLRVSEIEGDAVLFFRKGKLPSLKALIDQCSIFYKEFYRQLFELVNEHKSKKDSTKMMETLGLKIILHYGLEIESVQIGKHIKLIGEDIVVAHKLLKNKILLHDYVLFSENLLKHYDLNDLEHKSYWSKLNEDGNFYEHIGKVKYHYLDLKPLLKEL